MKSAVFLYNTQSGKCKIGHCTDSICTVFRAYGYEITPQPIDFEANPFDGNEPAATARSTMWSTP